MSRAAKLENKDLSMLFPGAQRAFVFSYFLNFEPYPASGFRSFRDDPQHFLHTEGKWPATCINAICLRTAFNIMNKIRVPRAKTAVANLAREFWRTSRTIRRITGGTDA